MRNRNNRTLTLYGIKSIHDDVELDIIVVGYKTYVIDTRDEVARKYLSSEMLFPIGYQARGIKVIDNNIERAVVINFLSPINKMDTLIETFTQYCGEYKKWTIINT